MSLKIDEDENGQGNTPGTKNRELHRLNFQVMPMVRYCPTHGVLQTHEGGTEGKTGTDKAHQGND
ncbi:TPA: hypothetical protein NDU46_005568 [Pseudomonas aeruginosa]|nr:hypothetical protein [Pseudomonas aeruginosa]